MDLSTCLVVVCLNCLLLTEGSELYESPNVKTALFTELDVRRSCWNHEEISLLRARMIMQDLIPKKIPRDLPYLLEYLRSTEEAVVKHSPEGKVRRIMMLALSDIIGGYLQAVVIPIAKESYYAGNVDYSTVAKLVEMLAEMKARLRTDGGRWSRPIDMSNFQVKVTQLTLNQGSSELACKAVYVTSRDNCPRGQSRIAIPYLDYDLKPGAVALPLRSRNLFSLKTAASSHIIMRFYILARECLKGMHPSETEVFNYLFLDWLLTRVVPHLYENTWYPGFGSVMRIVQTVNGTAMSAYKSSYNTSNTSLETSLLSGKCDFITRVRMLIKFNFWWLILFLFLCMLLLAICCFGCCLCYKYYKGYKTLGPGRPSGMLNAVLSIYCGFKDEEHSGSTGGVDSRELRSKEFSGNDYFDPETGHFRHSSTLNKGKVSIDKRFSVQDRPSLNIPPPIKSQPAGDADTSSVPSTSEDEESITSTTQ